VPRSTRVILWVVIHLAYGTLILVYTYTENLANIARILAGIPSWSKLPVWVGVPVEIIALLLAGWTLNRQSSKEWYAWITIYISRILVGIIWILTPYTTGWTGPPLPGPPPFLNLIEIAMIGLNIIFLLWILTQKIHYNNSAC